MDSALHGWRVLDLADEKGAYCGKLLADLGADVIKIEPPGGDATRRRPPFWGDAPHPDRGLFFLYMNTSKRGVTLDLAAPDGQALFKRLARTADLVIETFPPGHLDGFGVGYDALRADHPQLVFTSITGFGQSGPQRDAHTADIVASALGGAMHLTGAADDPPVMLAGSQAYVTASLFAAVSSLLALHHSATSGEGQHVDISIEEAIAAATHICGAGKWLDDGMISTRMGTGLFASVPSGVYPCRDGSIYLMINRPSHWQVLAQWIHEVTGNAAVLDPIWDGPSAVRQSDRALLDGYIAELTSRFTVDECYHEGQRRHLAITPVNTAAAVASDPQLAARGYFVDVEHAGGDRLRYPGAPYRHTVTPWRIAHPAPRIGEHNDAIFGGELGLSPERRRAVQSAGSLRTGMVHPLHGLRVVEFTAGMAGPWIGRFMAYCGAEVIKVESHRRPDVTRQYVPPYAPEMGIQSQLSPWLTDWNAGKRCVALDLTNADAVALAKRVIAASDVVVENYRTGVMDKLGLGYADLARAKPDLVMLSSSGYGDTGPYRNYVTWGPNIEALSALSTVSGFPERDCTITQYAYPDVLSALHGLVAVLGALDYRRRTGRGQYINLSQLEATTAAIGHVLLEHLANGREPESLGNRSQSAAPHGCYRCRGDDRWCAIAVTSEAMWARFCGALGKPEWCTDACFATLAARQERAAELDELIETWTTQRDAYEVMHTLQRAGVAAGVVQNIADQFERDPQLRARNFFETIPHAKKGTVVANGIPLGLTGTPGKTEHAGAAIGQDNDHVFGTLLGMTREEIQHHVDSGAIEASGA
jgi:crotonobetainyl-CoA:carnitine CoA-transferase CaiB-like acyl-CoA transferase